MCTAISVSCGSHLFGRNLDYEHTFGEKITITPRNYSFSFANGKKLHRHYAMIGMALPYKGYPLYFDATNERGLSMAGLNFPGNAVYGDAISGKDNVASFELMPWILSRCATTEEAELLLNKINITGEAISSDLPPTPLHWIVADRHRALTVEQTRRGLDIYENQAGVLTNNPTFDIQLFNLNNYMKVSPGEPVNEFSSSLPLETYGRGMGGLGIPGDLSSMSRFVRACFTKLNSVWGSSDREELSQFFHILYSVYQQRGCVRVGDSYEITNYTSCCNTDKGVYYYTTYDNSRINAVDMNKENLEGDSILTFDPVYAGEVNMQN